MRLPLVLVWFAPVLHRLMERLQGQDQQKELVEWTEVLQRTKETRQGHRQIEVLLWVQQPGRLEGMPKAWPMAPQQEVIGGRPQEKRPGLPWGQRLGLPQVRRQEGLSEQQ
jgi:hypothetical protein